jgi:inosine/xanthosine triphosphatase
LKTPTIVAVGSKRAVKARAVFDALTAIRTQIDPNMNFDVRGFDVGSGVSHTPKSRDELMKGARSRVAGLTALARESGEKWDYLIGLEGGLDVIRENDSRLAFLESWALVVDPAGRESWGHSGGIVLPDALAREVLDAHVELSQAIDHFAGEKGIRDAQGAWGVLTHNLIKREDVLRTAVINAFAPFFNSAAYSR